MRFGRLVVWVLQLFKTVLQLLSSSHGETKKDKEDRIDKNKTIKKNTSHTSPSIFQIRTIPQSSTDSYPVSTFEQTTSRCERIQTAGKKVLFYIVTFIKRERQ